MTSEALNHAARISFVLVFVTCLLPMMTSAVSSNSRPRSKAPQAKIKVDGVGHWFVDEYNRVRLFRGVNAVQKYFPWYPPYMLDDKRLDDLAKSGFNVVRLGSMWSGVEPADGVFNDTYIGILRDIIQRCADRGIYTILDMHQDVLSSLYYAYDGAPLWLMESFPEPTNPYPWPLEKVDAWALGYLTQACSEGFQFIYNNTNSALEKWARFWGVVAERLGRDQPAVLGYEWINEPWVGDYFQQPSLITPGISGKQNLLPTYDYINEFVRRIDPVSIQFYEPITIGVAFDNSREYFGSGLDRVPGGWYYNDVSAYAYHIYCWYMEVLPGDASDDERLEAAKNCTERLVPRVFQAQEDDVKITGGASILTEFGLCRTDGDSNQQINIDCEVFLDLADQYIQSWADWDYQGKWYMADGGPNIGRQRAFSRPYARATAGTPTLMFFNSTTRVFQLTYRPNRSILTTDAPTDIYVPVMFHYTSGYTVTVSPPEVTWDADGDSLYVRHDGIDAENFPNVISLVIRPVDE